MDIPLILLYSRFRIKGFRLLALHWCFNALPCFYYRTNRVLRLRQWILNNGLRLYQLSIISGFWRLNVRFRKNNIFGTIIFFKRDVREISLKKKNNPPKGGVSTEGARGGAAPNEVRERGLPPLRSNSNK
jgi:hypothetical protein